MKYTIEQLSFIVSAISFGFLFIITSINIYFKIRRRFPATVNCWFCNENTKIPYDDLNKWTCKKCEQYNGFAEDGDYNCDIPAQRSSKLNKWKVSSFSSMNGSMSGRLTPPQNGLCDPCNRNQELKVQQLASFEPENENYFDEEIQEYRQKLEQAYRLCPRCERHLKRTLNRVKTNILGSKLKQIGKKGLQAFNLNANEKTNKTVVYKKRLIFARISLAVLVLISILQTFTIMNQIKITKPRLDSVFNAGTTKAILTTLSYISAVKIVAVQLLEHVIQLPYISFGVACMKIAINYVYGYMSGDFWSQLNTGIIELVEDNLVKDDTNINSSTLTTNVSGCFLSIFLLFLFGLGWGPVLSLLLWSSSMIIPSAIHNTDDVKQILLLDFVQVTVAWASVILSITNFIKLPNKQSQLSDKQNTSFHRIESEVNSDASDESDVESELNTSHRSNLSSFSKRSWNETKLHNSTLSSESPSLYSHSLLSGRSFGASTQSLKQPQRMNTTFAADRSFHGGSHMDLPQNRLNSSFNQTEYYPERQCSSRMSFHSMNKTFTNGADCLRSPSRNSMYDIPNNFESGITRMSIGGLGNKLSNMKKPSAHVFGSSDAFGDILRHRNSVLTPSRLSLNEPHHSMNQSPASSSWLAGGFWNSTSPQKKSTHHVNNFRMDHQAAARDMHMPMISRASSKSSGFESRENSLCDDTEIDRTFIFPEPASLTQSAKVNANGLIKPQPQKPNGFSNGTNGAHWNQQANISSISSNQSERSWSNYSMLSRSMSQFSLQPPQSPTLSNSSFQNHLENNSMKSDRFSLNLNRFNHDTPIPKFQRGSLIKLHDTTSGTNDN